MHNKYAQELALLDAQVAEFEKIAISPAGMGRLVGAVGGGLAGAGAGYATAPQDQKAQRALGWGILGALGGVGAGQVATRQGQRQVGRFAQRQLHGVTGYLPGRGILGRGKKGTKWYALGEAPKKGVTRKQRMEGLEEMRWGGLKDAPGRLESKAKPEGRVGKFLRKRREAALEARRGQAREGETHLRGLLAGYAKHPLQTTRRALQAPGLAMGVGVPAAFIGPGAIESVQTGDVRPVLRSTAETAGYALTGGLPLVPAMAAGTGLASLSGKVLGSQRPQPQLQMQGHVVPAQQVRQ